MPDLDKRTEKFTDILRLNFIWYRGILKQKLKYFWLDLTCEHMYEFIYKWDEKGIRPHSSYKCIKCDKWKLVL